MTQGKYVYRFAPNPYAEGYAAGQYIGKIGVPDSPGAPKRVAALVGTDPNAAQRLDGLRVALQRYGISLHLFPATGAGLAAKLENLLPASEWLGIYADGNFNELTAAMRVAGNQTSNKVNPTPIIVPQTLATERFVIDSGYLGAEGQVRAISDVDPTSNDAYLYAELVPQVVGELATTPGLSGFVAGQALAYGMVKGDSAASIAGRLQRPGVFSTIATSPWGSNDPADGTLIFRALLAEFLPDNLIPSTNGGASEPYEGDFFEDGAWEPASPELFSPLPINLTGKDGVDSKSDGTYGDPIQNAPGGGTDGSSAADKKLRAEIESSSEKAARGGTG